MTPTIKRKYIVNRAGEPEEVIIPWAAYVEIAEQLGWDLSREEEGQLREALEDSAEAKGTAFIAMGDLK